MSIVITGNPGVGKHTVVEKIAHRLELPIIDINKIAKESGLFEENEDVNDIDTEKLKKILQGKISDNNLIVGHLAPYVLDKSQVKIMIVLRRSPYDLITVYKNRKYSDKKIKDNTGSEILGIIAHDAINRFEEKTVQIDITGKTIEENEERIISIISTNKGNENVDWLDLVTKNNDLRKFFSD
ncbi:adenylate kinase family protein [Nitrosopumilus adriaticus]|uniref:adenylate kinase family protein n=1 Tax=Nitrosopumilus adriaticus TaxID=1580092 RepID=UPI00352DC297